ncbi:MAG TPA: HEAT repeat domain-containing protein [Steroidobacteraceae bacterium]|nr:HEAT repeat domain-containing protein [Steroidobacteraceae bacterium]
MPLVRKPTTTGPARSPSAADVSTSLGSANPDERWAAARAAAELPDAAPALAAALSREPDARVREAMFTSLARIATRDEIRLILPLLRSNDAALRMGALDALRSSAMIAREALSQLLSDPDADVRTLSCELARSLPSEEASRTLCALLTHESEVNVCAAAIEVLAEVGDPGALPALAQCAQRLSQAPFLSFAIEVATKRITAAGLRG